MESDMRQLSIILFIALFLLGTFSIAAQDGPSESLASPNRLIWGPDDPYADAIYIDGDRWRIIKTDKLYIGIVGIETDSYFIIKTFVGNLGTERINVLPEASFVQMWKKDKDFLANKPADYLERPIPPGRIAEKIRRRAYIANALGAIGAGFQTQTATVRNTTTGQTATITAPNTAAANQAAANARQRNAESDAAADRFESEALLANTVFADKSVAGDIYFKHRKHEFGIFVIKIEGQEFAFVFGATKK